MRNKEGSGNSNYEINLEIQDIDGVFHCCN